MSVSLPDLRAFLVVAEMASFQRAAAALNLSQPALTRRVQKLEEALGVKLLERTTRRIAPSIVGREFLPKVRHLLDELDASLLSVKKIAERSSGQVNIACVPTAAYYYLPEVIRTFSSSFPRIRVRVVDEGANLVLQSVLEGDTELGINLLGIQEPDLEFEPLLEEPFMLACRRDHPLAAKRQVSWAELAPYRFITVGRMSGNRMLIDRGLAEMNWQPRWLYEVQHLITSLSLIEAGLGVAALPRMAVPLGTHHVIVSRPLVNPVVTRTVGIIKRRGAILSPAAEAFYQQLKATWSQEGERGKRRGRGRDAAIR